MPVRICKNGHRFEKTSDCPTCPVCSKEEIAAAYRKGFPRIGSPAFFALKKNGITLSDLPNYSEKQLLAIHGVGPKAVAILRDFLAESNLSFSNNQTGKE